MSNTCLACGRAQRIALQGWPTSVLQKNIVLIPLLILLLFMNQAYIKQQKTLFAWKTRENWVVFKGNDRNTRHREGNFLRPSCGAGESLTAGRAVVGLRVTHDIPEIEILANTWEFGASVNPPNQRFCCLVCSKTCHNSGIPGQSTSIVATGICPTSRYALNSKSLKFAGRIGAEMRKTKDPGKDWKESGSKRLFVGSDPRVLPG